MTIYRCIGKGTTDSKGIAHITHDCNGNSLGSNNTGYTGTGAGLVNVIASTDPPSQISNDSNQSGRCDVFDCIHYVPCTSNTNNWSKFPNVDATYSDEGVHFTANATGSQAVNFVGNSTYFDASNSYVFEFDFKTANTVQMTFLTDGGTRRHIYSDYSGGHYNTWFNVKLIYNANTQKVTPVINGVAKTDVDLSSYDITVLGFSLADWQGDINCWIKDFKMYFPLFDHAVSSITITGKNVIQTDETSILTITPQGENGHPVRNALIDLYKDDTKIATLDTGFNGEAIYTYTGTGSGQHSFKAKYKTIQSEPYPLHDDLFYCKGTSGEVNQYWNAESGLTSTPDTEGNLLENSTSGGKSYYIDTPTASTILDFSTPLCVEFKCISTTGARIFFNSNTDGSNVDRSFSSYITGNNKVKMIVRANNYDLIVDDETKLSNKSHSLVNPVGIRLVVNGNCNLKYSDFEIYSI